MTDVVPCIGSVQLLLRGHCSGFFASVLVDLFTCTGEPTTTSDSRARAVHSLYVVSVVVV